MKLMRYFIPALTVLASSLPITTQAEDFPITIEHKFGTSVIPEKPERVASIDYGGIGNLLAVGVEPVTVRQWRPGDGFDYTAGPWAEPYLNSQPLVLEGDLNFEAIAGTNPDIIIALYSGIDADDYEKLSLIAPVVPVPEGKGNYDLPWDERARLAAYAVGEAASAEQQIDVIHQRLADIASAHPQWHDLTVVVGGFRDANPWAYTRNDARTAFLLSMGFKSPPALDELTDEHNFNIELSPEQVDVINADVLVHYGNSEKTLQALDHPAHPFLKASQSGGEIYLPNLVVAALARISLLSIPSALDALEPMLEAAADGDPETRVPDARY
ncbi:ABC transporter substrate-binding protein [Saccharospirillum impatiens]|uniref:ABC transporter substrate-binding protein n=1 Tax=Saccharospirillum impatiens TaxID=169438 RepID=UPI00040F21A7|nr:ABC transporter substrate-binding protein [Saccharospirillum impatiens]